MTAEVYIWASTNIVHKKVGSAILRKYVDVIKSEKMKNRIGFPRLSGVQNDNVQMEWYVLEVHQDLKTLWELYAPKIFMKFVWVEMQNTWKMWW